MREMVKEALRRRNQSQRWLAEKMGVAPTTIQKYFRNPTAKTLEKIRTALPEFAEVEEENRVLAVTIPVPENMREPGQAAKYIRAVLDDPQARQIWQEWLQGFAQLSPQQREALLATMRVFLETEQ